MLRKSCLEIYIYIWLQYTYRSKIVSIYYISQTEQKCHIITSVIRAIHLRTNWLGIFCCWLLHKHTPVLTGQERLGWINFVQTLHVVTRNYREQWPIGTNGERKKDYRESVVSAWFHDYDDEGFRIFTNFFKISSLSNVKPKIDVTCKQVAFIESVFFSREISGQQFSQ